MVRRCSSGYSGYSVMSLLAVENRIQAAILAARNAKMVIDEVRMSLSYYAEEAIDESFFVAASRLMDVAVEELKKQTVVIKQSEQYLREYGESYITASIGGPQQDFFKKSVAQKKEQQNG